MVKDLFNPNGKAEIRPASIDWPERWNESAISCASFQDGANASVTGFLGSVRFRLDTDDAKHISRLIRDMADHIDKLKAGYDQ